MTKVDKLRTEAAWEEYICKERERNATYQVESCEPYQVHWAEDGGYMHFCEEKRDAPVPPDLTKALDEGHYAEGEYDAVGKPKHYMVLDGVEAKHIIKELTKGLSHWEAYCYGNVLKYVLRSTKKGKFSQDLMKCRQYIDMMNLS